MVLAACFNRRCIHQLGGMSILSILGILSVLGEMGILRNKVKVPKIPILNGGV